MHDLEAQEALIAICREIACTGLTHGTSGNVSVRRNAQEFFVSPSGMPYDELTAADVPLVHSSGRWFGRRRPSSEWRIHRDIFASRADVAAIVHTHSRHATALGCTGRGIPAFHYMVAVAGGTDIRCAPYHPFGTQALSDAALSALEGRCACLLGNHGVIACGTDLRAALALAAEVENLAAQYLTALQLGGVRILDQDAMRLVIDKFRTYGTQGAVDPDLVFAAATLPAAPGIP
jgi:L-fuculose-phosphate aldolase